MYSTSLNLFQRRKNKRSSDSSNTTRSLKFKNTFVKAFPRNSSCLKNFHRNLLIPNLIKPPTSSLKQVDFFPISFCTKKQRSGRDKYICQNSSLKYCDQRKTRNPYRNHMASNSSICSRRRSNSSSPKGTPPSNSSITQLISSKNTSNGKNTQRNNHKKRNSRNCKIFFLSSSRCIKNSNLDTETICTSQTCNRHQNQMSIRRKASRRSPRKFQNCVFRIVSSLKRPSLKTQTSKQKNSPGQRQCSMSTTRSTHILDICTCMNNNTSSQEQQCFETCVCHQMIHCLSIMAQRQCNNHISLLATCTICNDTFHIILHQSHTSSHQTSYGTNPQKNRTSKNATFPKTISTCNLKDSCSYQSCSMNQSRYWSWSFHSVSKPNMQTNLCTFSLCTSLEKKTNPVRIFSRCSQNWHLRSISTSYIPPTKKKSKKQKSITDTIHLHCFLSCFCSSQTMKPKTNQQITANTNHFPPNQKSNQVICGDQQLHRSSKKTQIALKSRQMRISLHVSDTINMDTKTH